jgi:hypothetical protein
MGAVYGLILHIQEGTQAGSISWCKNPASKVSAHFFNAKNGQLVQLVSVTDAAWAEVNGNPHWISVENEGYSGDSLTDAQVQNCARLLARCHTDYSTPLQICDDPQTGRGLTGHGLGGAAFGDHPDCPGTPVLNQRPQIIARAATILNPPTPLEDDMPTFTTGELPPGFAFDGGATDLANVHVIPVPPPNGGLAKWGNVWFSMATDFGDATVRVAWYVNGSWIIKDNIVVAAAGPRVNPMGGPLPGGTEKISIGRRRTGPTDTDDAIPLGYLVEVAAR